VPDAKEPQVPSDPRLIRALSDRGVILHAPESTFLEDLDPSRFEPGVEIFPGCTLRGRQTLIGAGSRLGQAGGGYFENLRAGRQVELQGGYFQDCVILDGSSMRGQAEVRRGSLIEEMGRAGQGVGYKMSVLLPFVSSGSLVNFADALVAGGSGPEDFTELGSVLALYNYSPSGDKWASRFGDVPSGVFLRSPRIFVGGQAQIVSPVRVGYGSVIAAGSSLRRDLAAGRLHSQPGPVLDQTYAPSAYGPLSHKLEASADFVGQLHALHAWYRWVRLPFAAGDAFQLALYEAARIQLEAGIAERLSRLEALIHRIPTSLAAHQASLESATDPQNLDWHRARIAEHQHILDTWPTLRTHLELPDLQARGLKPPSPDPNLPFVASPPSLDRIASALRETAIARTAPESPFDSPYLSAILHLHPDLRASAHDHLQTIVDRCQFTRPSQI
jgi:UDP-N-acetylglucosamine/UDP-N-acetylgalactosamine diphosphorylase